MGLHTWLASLVKIDATVVLSIDKQSDKRRWFYKLSSAAALIILLITRYYVEQFLQFFTNTDVHFEKQHKVQRDGPQCVQYTPFPEEKRPRYFRLQLSHFFFDFYNFYNIGNRNEYSRITYNLFN